MQVLDHRMHPAALMAAQVAMFVYWNVMVCCMHNRPRQFKVAAGCPITACEADASCTMHVAHIWRLSHGLKQRILL